MSASFVAQVEELILASYGSMYRLAYSYVKNQDDAMDIVQESAYKAIKAAASLRKPNHLKTWLWRIVINTALDFMRRQQTEISCDAPPEPAAEDHYADFDTLEALDAVIPGNRRHFAPKPQHHQIHALSEPEKTKNQNHGRRIDV